MSRPVETPTVTTEPGPGGMAHSVTRHPAFAQIGASRVSGHTALYDSDFTHNAYMTVTVRLSELHRTLSNDWHFGRGELIEIAMSEAQWATFVSSPNVGGGVCCTLQHLKGEVIPGLPRPAARHDQFGKEMQHRIQGSIDQLDAAIAKFDELGLPKGKAEAARAALRSAKSAVSTSMTFIAEQFDEHMEGTVEKAKAEVHGYMTGVLMRSGLDALGVTPPLLLQAPEPDQD